ncbi:MAG: type II toxin-antitoxin system RelE/ParE family toxin [Candidatus Aenigmarchaeota archaeon]|nr:type II toxin-antitoxin system RelE/ParE family toxin [Candidatus Aenigmarchaeota archaeon]
MKFSVFYDKQPKRFLKKLDKKLTKRILNKINRVLSNDPVPHDAKPIVGKHGVFRIRIGGYRALYRINYKEKKVIVFKLDKRSRIY